MRSVMSVCHFVSFYCSFSTNWLLTLTGLARMVMWSICLEGGLFLVSFYDCLFAFSKRFFRHLAIARLAMLLCSYRRNHHGWKVGGDLTWGGCHCQPSFSSSIPSPFPVIAPPMFYPFPSVLFFPSALKFSKDRLSRQYRGCAIAKGIGLTLLWAYNEGSFMVYVFLQTYRCLFARRQNSSLSNRG